MCSLNIWTQLFWSNTILFCTCLLVVVIMTNQSPEIDITRFTDIMDYWLYASIPTVPMWFLYLVWSPF